MHHSTPHTYNANPLISYLREVFKILLPDNAVIHADGSITIDNITFYSIDDYYDYVSE